MVDFLVSFCAPLSWGSWSKEGAGVGREELEAWPWVIVALEFSVFVKVLCWEQAALSAWADSANVRGPRRLEKRADRSML
ncbi:hypothetical protein QG37_07210 [Candidozyma auris]|nr:hypothetical protein QG37_07210 [[Candida] auris]